MTKSLASPPIDVSGRRPTEWNFFGPPPLLEGEDPAAYDELLARVSGAVGPSDILEEIWVRDVVDLVWEALRLRRLKSGLIDASIHEGLTEILRNFVGWTPAEDLAKRWVRNDVKARKEISKMLTSAGLTMESAAAQTLALKIDEIERIDRMIMNAEARRNAVLREIDGHRASVAQALRRATDIEDVQFEELRTKQIADRNAA
jgi:hypothetical protein